jgi:hypothetical protein
MALLGIQKYRGHRIIPEVTTNLPKGEVAGPYRTNDIAFIKKVPPLIASAFASAKIRQIEQDCRNT